MVKPELEQPTMLAWGTTSTIFLIFSPWQEVSHPTVLASSMSTSPPPCPHHAGGRPLVRNMKSKTSKGWLISYFQIIPTKWLIIELKSSQLLESKLYIFGECIQQSPTLTHLSLFWLQHLASLLRVPDSSLKIFLSSSILNNFLHLKILFSHFLTELRITSLTSNYEITNINDF